MHQLQTKQQIEERTKVKFFWRFRILLAFLIVSLFNFTHRDYPYITTNTADSYMGEKDVVIIWISEEHGLSHLAHQQTLNAAVTRARKCLLICGANLTSYKVLSFSLIFTNQKKKNVDNKFFFVYRIDPYGDHY